MIKRWIKVIIICCCFFQASAYAETVNIELKYFSKASYYLGQGKYKLAASQWHQLSVVFLRSEAKLGNRKMWQYAGLAEALAAMAADKNNDVVAYQYWADSTRYLMTGGTNWSLIQKQLHQRFETTNTQLSAFMQVNDLAVNDSDKWQQDLAMLQTWSDKLAVFTFTSPQLGLSGQRAPTAVLSQQPAVNYKGAFQPNKKLTGLGNSTFRGNQITPVSNTPKAQTSTLDKQITGLDEEISVLDTRSSTSNKLTSAPVSSAADTLLSTDSVASKQDVPSPTTTNMIVPGLSPSSTPAEVEPVEHMPLVEISEIAPKDKPVSVSKYDHQPVQKEKEKEKEKVETTQPSPLSRGNMASIEDENVEALQRRSFAPVPVN